MLGGSDILLPARECPALLSSAGGRVYLSDPATGEQVGAFAPFPDAANVPLYVGQVAGLIVVGAGFGGGPREAAFDAITLREVWSVYVGDPASRTGVSVSATTDPTGPFPPLYVAPTTGATSGVLPLPDPLWDGVLP